MHGLKLFFAKTGPLSLFLASKDYSPKRKKPRFTLKWCRPFAGMLLLHSSACWAGCSLISGSTVEATDTVDITELLTMQSSAAKRSAGTWEIPVNCWAVIPPNEVNFISPLGNGYWVNFINAAGVSRWVKFQVSEFLSKLSYNNASPVLRGEDIAYTLTASLADGEPNVTDGNYYQVTHSNSVSLIPMVIYSTNRLGSVPDIDKVAAVAASGSWDSSYLGYQSLRVTFNPAETTCEMPNQQVTLPRIPLSALREGQENGSTPFELPITCLNTLAGGATRSLSAWLSSADVIDDNRQIMRNSSSTSSGIGFILSDSRDQPLTLDDSEASKVLEIASGGDINVAPPALKVAYKIYDPATLSPGSVVATATLYFNYD
ncbi:fimbrial protein [Kalamiella sp. sgz302252]|uniref:fimbrial protein n=1 Tax=Pantoea sp. sgz302252 TaxID=3341827 RepID=UPI0036D268A6